MCYGILIYLSFIVPILLIVITFYWWFKYGRDNMVVQTVEFRPPQRLNSATIGLIYKGDVGIDDVTSLLIDFGKKICKVAGAIYTSLSPVAG